MTCAGSAEYAVLDQFFSLLSFLVIQCGSGRASLASRRRSFDAEGSYGQRADGHGSYGGCCTEGERFVQWGWVQGRVRGSQRGTLRQY
jgi:hypothetical protein